MYLILNIFVRWYTILEGIERTFSIKFRWGFGDISGLFIKTIPNIKDICIAGKTEIRMEVFLWLRLEAVSKCTKYMICMNTWLTKTRNEKRRDTNAHVSILLLLLSEDSADGLNMSKLKYAYYVLKQVKASRLQWRKLLKRKISDQRRSITWKI